MYCIDTNIVIDVFRGDEKLKNKVIDIVSSGEEVYISSISLCELFKGAYIVKTKERQEEDLYKIKSFTSSFDMVSLDENSCEEFGKIYGILKEAGKMVPEPDIMIASIAKSNNLILITRDKKHFKDTGVKVEEW